MDESQLRYPGWRVAAASAIGVFFWSMPVFTLALFLRPMAEELQVSRQTISLVFAAAPLAAALCSAPVGFLVDRRGARAVVIPLLTLSGVAFASRALLTQSIGLWVVVFVVTGIAGAASPVGYARLISTWFDRRRGMALAVLISGASLGAIFHPPIGAALIRALGWRGASVVFGAAVILIGVPIVIAFVRPRPQSSSTHAATAAKSGASIGEGLRSPIFWVIAIVVLCDSIVSSSFRIHLAALLSDRGLAGGAAALSAMGAAGLLGRVVTGWLLDRYFAVYISCGLLLAAAAGTLLLSGASTLPMALIGASLVGFGGGGESDVTPFLLSRYFGLRSFSTLYGVTYIMIALAAASGSVMMGRAFDTTGSYEGQLFTLVFVLVGAAALVLTLPRYRPAESSRAAVVSG